MAKTYTFPAVNTLSGSLSIEVITSDGSGTEAIEDRYFSDEVSIVNETEFLGGDLQSAYADLIIDYDKDNFFSDTILPSALAEGGYVLVKISVASRILFYGRVEPQTISREPFHSDNDGPESDYARITFRCSWVMSLLKGYDIDYVSAQLDTLKTGADEVPSSGGWTLIGASLGKVLTACMNVLRDELGFSYSLTFDQVNMTFFSKEGYDNDGTNLGTDYNFNIGTGAVIAMGERDDINIFDAYILRYEGATNSPLGLFDTNSGKINTSYDLFVAVMKSFGVICSVSHTSSVDLVVRMGTRVSGSPKTITDVIELTESPLSEYSRSGANVSSLVSGNQFNKLFDGMGATQFSQQTVMDFGNDLDFPGGADYVNSPYSLAYPVPYPADVILGGVDRSGPHFALLRYCGIGLNKLNNPNFSVGGLTGWTQDSGSWHAMSPEYGTAYVEMGSTAEKQLSQTLSEVLDANERYILSGRFVKSWSGSPVAITLKFLNSAGNVLYSESKTINATNGQLKYAVSPEKSGFARQRTGGLEIAKIAIAVVPSSAMTSGDYVYVSRLQLLSARKGCPDIIGRNAEQYFGQGGLKTKKMKLNNVQTGYSPRDYFDAGQRYFLKKVAWKLKDNTTEIEAINYPY